MLETEKLDLLWSLYLYERADFLLILCDSTNFEHEIVYRSENERDLLLTLYLYSFSPVHNETNLPKSGQSDI